MSIETVELSPPAGPVQSEGRAYRIIERQGRGSFIVKGDQLASQEKKKSILWLTIPPVVAPRHSLASK